VIHHTADLKVADNHDPGIYATWSAWQHTIMRDCHHADSYDPRYPAKGLLGGRTILQI
jgi:hypothetical protein